MHEFRLCNIFFGLWCAGCVARRRWSTAKVKVKHVCADELGAVKNGCRGLDRGTEEARTAPSPSAPRVLRPKHCLVGFLIFLPKSCSAVLFKLEMALFIWLIICLIQLVFSAGTVFFSHKKSGNSVFQPAYNSSRTAPMSSTHIDRSSPV
jgi:hypothetical protein